ncbi:hypothetical protein BpHYR1_033383 [Brachionus plicatilis]|uniref:Uncharacterized protein n=1 Tax=Brachionus plicatilis TaxID=10195 RepID=A0A3M7P9N4_BRAPC|nr:hypothetical protein BpHYR1_033383 [Brachionus plicatilis]
MRDAKFLREVDEIENKQIVWNLMKLKKCSFWKKIKNVVQYSAEFGYFPKKYGPKLTLSNEYINFFVFKNLDLKLQFAIIPLI